MKKNKFIGIMLSLTLILSLFQITAAAAPAAPTFALAEDTGIADDYITSNGQIDVSGIETGATWEYSVDSGSTWTTGSDSSFTLADGTYTTGMIQVRQTLSSETSDITSNTSEIVVAQNQITNGDFQSGNSGFSSDYTYSSDCTSEGVYYIVTTPSEAHYNWDSDVYDHTYGTTDGLFFVANGSGDVSEVVWQSSSTITVEANQTYRFEATLMSLSDGYSSESTDGYPLVRFQIGDGTNWVDLGASEVEWELDEKGIWHLIYADGIFTESGTYYIRLLNDQSEQYNDLGVDDIYFGLRGAAPSASDSSTNPTDDPQEVSILSLSLADDTGSDSSDSITSYGQINVSGIISGREWQYSTDSGTTWVDGSGSSFTLTESGDYSVIARQRNSSDDGWMAQTSAFTFTLDASSPSVTITSTESDPTNTSPFDVTITFSESVTGFESSDITVGNGEVSSFTGSGTTYTASITPTASGDVTVDIPAGAAEDSLETANTKATQFSIEYDGDAPSEASITINSGDSSTASTSVTLTLAADDSNTVEMIISEYSDFSDASYETFSETKSFTISSGDGTKTVYAKFKDSLGNETDVISATITLDTVGSEGTVEINSADTYTNSATVTLTLSSTDAAEVMISDDSSFTDASYEDYEESKSFTFSSDTEGTKTVYVKYKDETGNEGTAVSDTIILDTTAPEAAIASSESDPTDASPIAFVITFSETVEGFNATDITVTNGTISSLTNTDNTYYLAVTPIADGEVTVQLAASVAYDEAGNGNIASAVYSIESNVDAPDGTIKIDSGATYTNSTDVTLTISSDDAVYMIISEESDFSDASYEAYATSADFTLSSDEGTKTVYIMFKNELGNESEVISDTIKLDTTAPTNRSVSINSGSSSTSSRYVTLTIAATGASKMMISESSSFTDASWESYSTSTSFTLSSGSGTKTVYVKFKDAAGNVSSKTSDSITYYYYSSSSDDDDDDDDEEATATPTSTPSATESAEATPTPEIQSPDETEEATSGTITGRLTDINGDPLANVLVELHSDPQQTYTDSDGYFTFYNVELGEHTIYIVDDRFEGEYTTKIETTVSDTDSEEYSDNLATQGVTLNLEDFEVIEIQFIVQEEVEEETEATFSWFKLILIIILIAIIFGLIIAMVVRKQRNEGLY